jgi:hypothetical protein
MYRFAALASARPSPTHDGPTGFETMTLPALPVVERRKKRLGQGQSGWYSDRWFLALIICASCASVGVALDSMVQRFVPLV